MRTLLFLCLLIAATYATYYYVGLGSDEPLRIPLVRADLRQNIKRIQIKPRGPGEFLMRLDQGDNGQWIVSKDQKLIYDQSARVRGFLTDLANTVSDSVVTGSAARLRDRRLVTLDIHSGTGREVINLAFADDTSSPVYAWFESSSNLLCLSPSTNAWLKGYLTFDAYRERRLLDLNPAAVDSIVALGTDNTLLYRSHPSELPDLATHFIAPAFSQHADYFDEIAHQDRRFGQVLLYADGQPKTITVYHDSLWAQPYVLVGEDYPRRFLGYDALR